MGFEEDFVDENIVKLDVAGREFGYKPVTAGDENDWLPEYMERKHNEEGKEYLEQNIAKLNECKVRNIVSVPYSPGELQKVLGLSEPRDWKALSLKERWMVLKRMKPDLLGLLIGQMNGVDRKSPFRGQSIAEDSGSRPETRNAVELAGGGSVP